MPVPHPERARDQHLPARPDAARQHVPQGACPSVRNRRQNGSELARPDLNRSLHLRIAPVPDRIRGFDRSGWLRTGYVASRMPSRLKARFCSAVGLARTVELVGLAPGIATRLRVSEAR